MKTPINQVKISELLPDPHNLNQGTERGDALLEQSLQKLGAGRSILLDKNGRIIAGNKTALKFGELGHDEVIVVQTDGKKLVAVQRTDLDLDTPEGKEMALADNRVGEVNLSWDVEAIAELAEDVDLSDWFTSEDMAGWTESPTDGKEVGSNELWSGMPEFEQENLIAPYSIKVNFFSIMDLEKFAELIGQPVTEKTKWINFPFREPENLKAYRCVDES